MAVAASVRRPSADELIRRLTRRLSELGLDREIPSVLEDLSNIFLAQRFPEGAPGILTADQMECRARKESSLLDCDGPAVEVAYQRFESAADVERLMAAANLTRQEIQLISHAQEHGVEHAARLAGVSLRTAERRIAGARAKLEQHLERPRPRTSSSPAYAS